MKGKPQIDRVSPAAAIAGGEVILHGRGFADHGQRPPLVKFGEREAAVLVAGEDFLLAQVPEDADGSSVRIASAAGETPPAPIEIGVPLADNLHPVANPAVDAMRTELPSTSSGTWAMRKSSPATSTAA